MTDNPARPVIRFLLVFLAAFLVAADVQHFGLLGSALAALRAALYGAGT